MIILHQLESRRSALQTSSSNNSVPKLDLDHIYIYMLEIFFQEGTASESEVGSVNLPIHLLPDKLHAYYIYSSVLTDKFTPPGRRESLLSIKVHFSLIWD